MLPICDAFIAAAEQCGYPRNPDFNGAAQEGFGYYQLTTRNGRRCSTAVGYLKPARRRANLTVSSRALATRMLFSGKRATGVEYLQGERRSIPRAPREVMLAGGAFNSPQLMQLSGVGPAALLREHGIDVVADMPRRRRRSAGSLPRAAWCIAARSRFRPTTCSPTNCAASRPGLSYMLRGRGLLAMGAGYVGGFLRTNEAVETPDVQTAHHAVLRRRDRRAAACLLRRDLSGDRAAPGKPRHGAHQVGRSAPAARDRAELSLGRRRIATRRSRASGCSARIMAAPPMAPFVEPEHEPGPACASDDDLLDYVRRRGSTVYHPTSTCRMGSDPAAVVDARLRVHGFEGCAWSTPRSCRRSSPATPMRRRS